VKRIGAAVAIAVLSASAAISGDRAQSSRQGESFILFSGGIPAIEIKSNPGNTACPFEIKQPTRSKQSKPIFAVY